MRDELEVAMLSPRAPFLFWPGAPCHKMLRVKDLTNKPGLTGQFNTRGTLVAYDVTEGVDHNTVQNLSNTGVDITATEHVVMTYISDTLLKSVSDPYDAQMLMKEESEEHARAHMEKMDDEIFALASSLTAGVSTTGTNITVAGVQGAITALEAYNPARPLAGFLSAVQWGDLVAESSSPLANAATSGQVGAELWGNYKVNSFLGVDWFVSTNVYGNSTDWYGMIISPRCIGLTIKEMMKTTITYDASLRAHEIVSVSTWGVGVVEATQGVYLQTDY